MKKSTDSDHNPKKPVAEFDPFNNRLCRDIRNTLSEAFMAAIERMEPSAYQDKADSWFAQNPPAIMVEYIQDRLQRYERVIAQIMDGTLGKQFVLRDIYRNGWSSLSCKDDAADAVDVLCALNWLQEIPQQTGGKPKTVYVVNPKKLQVCPGHELTKPTKAPFVSNVSTSPRGCESFSDEVEPNAALAEAAACDQDFGPDGEWR